LLGPGSLPAQPITNRGSPNVIIMPGASLQIGGNGGPGSPITPAASVVNARLDMNAPTFANAEFDPRVANDGSPVTYRLIVGCPDGEVHPPENIPVPAGMTLTPGASDQQMVLVDGKVWRIATFNYHVAASHPDLFVVPFFKFPVNGKQVSVPDTFLQITSAGEPARRRPIELVLQAPKRTLFVGETITVHISLSGSKNGALQSMTALDVSGDALLVDQNSILSHQRKTIKNQNGQQSVTIETDAFVTPLRQGLLTLKAQAEAEVDQQEGLTSLVPGYRPLIEAVPAVIVATNVPTGGTLPGFNGAIGRFQIQSALSTNYVRVGDPLTLTVTLRGEGNIEAIPAPAIARDAAWQFFTPKADPPQPSPDSMTATRAFHYTLIPLANQIKDTPPIPFSYFDPATAKYMDLSVPPQALTVVPAPTNEVASPPASQPHWASRALPDDTGENDDALRPLVDSPGRVVRTLAPLQMRGWFLLVQLLPAMLLGGLWLRERRRRFLAAHPEVVALRQARRACRVHLARARAAAAAGDAPGFATAIVRAMRSLCAPMAAANPDSLVCADILELLPAERRAGPDGDLVRSFFAATNALLFSNGSVNAESLLSHRAKTEALLETMHGQLRAYVHRCVRQQAGAHSPADSGAFDVDGKSAPNAARAIRPAGLLLMLLMATSSRADQQPDKFQQGIGACVAGNYTQAAAAFRECARQEPSSGVFHNLGNAEWLQGNTGEAILAWERAAWLDTFNRNSRANLRFVRRVAHLDSPPLSWFEVCSAWLPASSWAWTAMGSFWLAGALLILPQALRWRKAYWHQVGAALGLTIFLLTLPALAGIQTRARRGVVVAEETPVRLTPTREGEVLARLNAGETVTVARRQAGCVYIRTVGGISGWVSTNNFRLIAE
jgi:hypothetical protein